MKLKSEIKQEFIGEINGVEFKHEGIYYAVFRILSAILIKFDPKNINYDFIENLKYAVMYRYNAESVELSVVEKEALEEIYQSEASKFTDFKFSTLKLEGE